MAERRIVKGWIVERGEDGTLRPIAPAGGQPPADPTFPYKGDQAAAGIRQTQASTARTQQQIDQEDAMFEFKRREAAAAAALKERELANAPTQPAARLTPGQQALDQAYAKDYADWTAGGGYAGVDRQIQALEGAIPKLQNSDTITGPIMGRLPNFVRSLINEDSVNIQDRTEEAIQGSLRQILGSQFTQAEGERLLARAYNPKVSEGENASRLRSVAGELRDRAKAKDSSARYFEGKGTLKGWTAPPRYTPGQDPRAHADAVANYTMETELQRLGIEKFPPAVQQRIREDAWRRQRAKSASRRTASAPRKQNRVIDWDSY